MPALVRLATPARAAWLSAAGLAFADAAAVGPPAVRLAGLPTTDLGASLTLRGLRVASRALPPALRETAALPAGEGAAGGDAGAPAPGGLSPPAQPPLVGPTRSGVIATITRWSRTIAAR